ncbi:MAG: ribonuclease H-like domain-containing protein, partial [Candidatus Aenigmarchaeota archaeon]|nr:ribonuclease H-like domain-containing protein [Candidatus Aenigmarchaeota archaeon]
MQLSFCLLDADYVTEEGKASARLFGVDENGSSIMILDDSFQPYFYVLPKSKAAVIAKLKKSSLVTKIEEVKRIVEGKEQLLLKIFVNVPASAYKVRESIKRNAAVENTFEYSVNFYKRYMMDKGFYPLDWLEVEGAQMETKEMKYKKIIRAKSVHKLKKKEVPKLKVLAFDTEVIDKKLVMISFAADDFRKVLSYKKAKSAELCKDEKEMLERFVEVINEQDPDFLITFNGDGFDFEVIRERADELKVPLKLNRDGTVLKAVRRGQVTAARLQGRIHIDLFPFVDTVLAPQLQFEAITLGDVAEELIGEGKLEMSFEEMLDSWKSGKIDKVAEYCLNDSLLTLKLSHVLLPQVLELSRVSGQLPFDSSRMAYGTLVESFFLRKGSEHNTIAPNSPHFAEVEKRRRLRPYAGGYVKEPKVGLHDNIAVFDFRSLYPSIIVTYNLSPETYKCSHSECKKKKVPGLKHHFCTKQKGFIPTHLRAIIEQRLLIKEEMKRHIKGSQEWKQLDEEQKAIKILANASYGYMNYAGSRWYSRETAESAAA